MGTGEPVKKVQENGSDRSKDRWTIRLRPEDLKMIKALTPYLQRSGHTDGSPSSFFRYLLSAAHKGLGDLARQEELRKAMDIYKDAEARLKEARAALEKLVEASGITEADLAKTPEAEQHGG